MFIIFINDTLNAVQGCVKLFTDDTKLFRIITSTADCDLMQRDIDAPEELSEKFYSQRCKAMRIGKGHTEYQHRMKEQENHVISLNTITLEKVFT